MTGNVRYNCYSHIHLLPTHPHLASADFVCFLPVATSADSHICLFITRSIFLHFCCILCLGDLDLDCWLAEPQDWGIAPTNFFSRHSVLL